MIYILLKKTHEIKQRKSQMTRWKIHSDQVFWAPLVPFRSCIHYRSLAAPAAARYWTATVQMTFRKISNKGKAKIGQGKMGSGWRPDFSTFHGDSSGRFKHRCPSLPAYSSRQWSDFLRTLAARKVFVATWLARVWQSSEGRLPWFSSANQSQI